MKIDKLLDSLNHYLKKGEKSNQAQCDQIDELLHKLKKKKKDIQKQLETENNPTKKKRLVTDLKIVTLQLKKGTKRREELKKKCK